MPEKLRGDARREAIREKVMSRVRINSVTGCWEWLGPTSGKPGRGRHGRGHSYPRMNLDGQTVAVHIVMWVNEHGYLPSKRQLDHTCENRICVNPAHTDDVTHKRNQKRRALSQRKKRTSINQAPHQGQNN